MMPHVAIIVSAKTTDTATFTRIFPVEVHCLWVIDRKYVMKKYIATLNRMNSAPTRTSINYSLGYEPDGGRTYPPLFLAFRSASA